MSISSLAPYQPVASKPVTFSGALKPVAEDLKRQLERGTELDDAEKTMLAMPHLINKAALEQAVRGGVASVKTVTDALNTLFVRERDAKAGDKAKFQPPITLADIRAVKTNVLDTVAKGLQKLSILRDAALPKALESQPPGQPLTLFESELKRQLERQVELDDAEKLMLASPRLVTKAALEQAVAGGTESVKTVHSVLTQLAKNFEAAEPAAKPKLRPVITLEDIDAVRKNIQKTVVETGLEKNLLLAGALAPRTLGILPPGMKPDSASSSDSAEKKS